MLATVMNAETPKKVQNHLQSYGVDKKHAPHLLGFAAEMAAQDKLEIAEAAATVAVAADSSSFDAWVTLGAIQARRREVGLALAAYEHAVAIDPKSARAWCDIGELKLSVFDYEGAIAALKRAIDADPKAKTPGGKRAQALVAKTAAKLTP